MNTKEAIKVLDEEVTFKTLDGKNALIYAIDKLKALEGEGLEERLLTIAEKVPCNIHMLHKHRQDIVAAICSELRSEGRGKK